MAEAAFDARADGTVFGSGVGVVVLKRLEDALRAGDRIHALIRGVGLSNDTDGKLLSPSSEGQLRAMRAAYREAGWSPASVDLVECHATGTPVGDAAEIRSLGRLSGTPTRIQRTMRAIRLDPAVGDGPPGLDR